MIISNFSQFYETYIICFTHLLTRLNDVIYVVQCYCGYKILILRIFQRRLAMSGQIRGAKEATLPALGLGRMDSCIKDPQQELLQTYKEGNLRWILTSFIVCVEIKVLMPGCSWIFSTKVAWMSTRSTSRRRTTRCCTSRLVTAT